MSKVTRKIIFARDNELTLSIVLEDKNVVVRRLDETIVLKFPTNKYSEVYLTSNGCSLTPKLDGVKVTITNLGMFLVGEISSREGNFGAKRLVMPEHKDVININL